MLRLSRHETVSSALQCDAERLVSGNEERFWVESLTAFSLQLMAFGSCIQRGGGVFCFAISELVMRRCGWILGIEPRDAQRHQKDVKRLGRCIRGETVLARWRFPESPIMGEAVRNK